MEIVKAFDDELSRMHQSKHPDSQAGIRILTDKALDGVKFYKHIVHCMEKFIQKCRPKCKVPGLYVIDSVVRRSRHRFGREKNVYVLRLSRNIVSTFKHLYKCPPGEKQRIIRVLRLWQKNSVFPPEIVQQLLVVGGASSETMQSTRDASTGQTAGKPSTSTTDQCVNGTGEVQPDAGALTTNMHAQLIANPSNPQIQQLTGLLSSSRQAQSQALVSQVESHPKRDPLPPRSQLAFKRAILDYDYSDEESPKSQQQQQEHKHKAGIDTELLSKLPSVGQLSAESSGKMLNGEDFPPPPPHNPTPFPPRDAQPFNNTGFTKTDVDDRMRPGNFGKEMTNQCRSRDRHRHRKRPRSRDRYRGGKSRSNDRHRSHHHRSKSAEREHNQEREMECEREKKGLPPLKMRCISYRYNDEGHDQRDRRREERDRRRNRDRDRDRNDERRPRERAGEDSNESKIRKTEGGMDVLPDLRESPISKRRRLEQCQHRTQTPLSKSACNQAVPDGSYSSGESPKSQQKHRTGMRNKKERRGGFSFSNDRHHPHYHSSRSAEQESYQERFWDQQRNRDQDRRQSRDPDRENGNGGSRERNIPGENSNKKRKNEATPTSRRGSLTSSSSQDEDFPMFKEEGSFTKRTNKNTRNESDDSETVGPQRKIFPAVQSNISENKNETTVQKPSSPMNIGTETSKPQITDVGVEVKGTQDSLFDINEFFSDESSIGETPNSSQSSGSLPEVLKDAAGQERKRSWSSDREFETETTDEGGMDDETPIAKRRRLQQSQALLADTTFSEAYKRHGASLDKLVADKMKADRIEEMEKILNSDLEKGGFRRILEREEEYSEEESMMECDEDTRRVRDLMKKDWGALPVLSSSSRIFKGGEFEMCVHMMPLLSYFTEEEFQGMPSDLRQNILRFKSPLDGATHFAFLVRLLKQLETKIQTSNWILEAALCDPAPDDLCQVVQSHLSDGGFSQSPFTFAQLKSAVCRAGIQPEMLGFDENDIQRKTGSSICRKCLQKPKKKTPKSAMNIIQILGSSVHLCPESLSPSEVVEYISLLLLVMQEEKFVSWQFEIVGTIVGFIESLKDWDEMKHRICDGLIDNCKELNVIQEMVCLLRFKSERIHELVKLLSFSLLNVHIFGRQSLGRIEFEDMKSLIDLVEHFNPDNIEAALQSGEEPSDGMGIQKRAYCYMSLLLPLLSICIGNRCDDQAMFSCLDRIWATLRRMNKRIRENGAIYRSQVKYELCHFTNNLRRQMQKTPKRNQGSIFKYLRSAPVIEGLVDNGMKETDSSNSGDENEEVSYYEENAETAKSPFECSDEFKIVEVVKRQIIGSAYKR